MDIGGVYFSQWVLLLFWVVTVFVSVFFGAYMEAKRNGIV